METKNKKIRESGIELLRIILMLQVIFLHVCTKGKYSEFGRGGKLGPWHSLLYWIVWTGSRSPVNLYILLSGYFQVTSNKTLASIKGKVWKTYSAMLFYSILIPLIGWALGWWKMKPFTIVSMFLPNVTRVWYFLTLYLIVLFLSPFLNKVLTQISKRDYAILIAFLTVLLSILPMLSRIEALSTYVNLEQIVAVEGGKGVYLMVYMYILGGYLRLHVKGHEKAKLRYLAGYAAMIAVNLLLRYNVPGYTKTAGTYDNIFIIIQGVFLVLYFRDLKFRSKLINSIAALNLGVYMIHEHLQLRWKIWNDIFPMTQQKSFYLTYKYPIKILLICVAIFTGCAIIEQLRVWLFAGVGKWKQKRLKE